MEAASVSTREHSLGPIGHAARTFVALTVVEAVVVVAYLAVTGTSVLSARYLVYPFVWVNAAVLAVVSTPVPTPSDRRTVGALAVAVGYLAVLCWAGGLLALGHGTGLGRLAVFSAPPGWGPMLSLTDGWVHVSVVPFKLVGYLGLSTLVYTALAQASRSVLSGLLGVVTCVSCTGSVLATLLAGTVGGSSVALSELMARSYDLSTAVFLLAIGAMWYGVRR